MLIEIRHTTTFHYASPVQLLAHRLMLWPRVRHDLTLVSARIVCDPAASVDYTQDVFGNVIASATFAQPADRLAIDAVMRVDQTASAWPVFLIDPSAHVFPFAYSTADVIDLGALRLPDAPAAAAVLHEWLAPLQPGDRPDTLSLLRAINSRVLQTIVYREREEEGTQSPAETLALRSGSCRDLATLFIEAVRALGIAARAVSGYLFDPPADGSAIAQHGTTHAWAEVYLPSAGWITFDPTNDRIGNAAVIPVASARTMAQLKPVEGDFIGAPGAAIDMIVSVEVERLDRPITEEPA